ncbi:MAG: aldo/keto reductase [Acidobacteria bacterium]|nr:aldo/keto reductase [Acidobacteriota bacterium]MBV9624849.1 aldo/keto reductase [Acidobacteriota bacterium]
MERREFLQGISAATVLGSLPLAGYAADGSTEQGIPYRSLGRSGEKVSLIGLGGAHVGRGLSESDALQLIRSAIDRGINFMDNSWDYNNGDSETRMGKALKDGYRQKVFLMTKLDGRTKQEAARQLDESLRRLETDHLDLIQHHEIIRFEDPDRIFAEGGAQEAVLEAKKAGKVRYIGFTGHKDPRIHLYMLEVAERHGFHFDTVQMPLNVMDAHFRSFAHLVLPELVKRQIGVLAMKTMGGGVILKSGVVSPEECLHYAMNLPIAVAITGISKMSILDQAVQAAKSFKPMTAAAVNTLLAKTRKAAADGAYELFKTSEHFDATAKHPEWLGGESTHVEQITKSS